MIWVIPKILSRYLLRNVIKVLEVLANFLLMVLARIHYWKQNSLKAHWLKNDWIDVFDRIIWQTFWLLRFCRRIPETRMSIYALIVPGEASETDDECRDNSEGEDRRDIVDFRFAHLLDWGWKEMR